MVLGSIALSFDYDYTIQGIVDSPIASLFWFFLILILATIWFGTRYRIENEILVIKVGPVKERAINIGDIDDIERSYDMTASPANSFKRLKLEYGGRQVLISPQDEEEFIEHLKSINPSIAIFNLEKNIKF